MPNSATLEHVSIVTDDFESSWPVYDAVLRTLGLTPELDYRDPESEELGDSHDRCAEPSHGAGTVAAVGYATENGRMAVLLVAGARRTTNAHFAVAVAECLRVDRACDVADRLGWTVLQRPRQWESDQLGYYGAQVVDLAGNVLEVCCRAPR